MVERVHFIHGMSTYIDKCQSLECQLFRDRICTNRNYRHCYTYTEYFKNKEEIDTREYGHYNSVVKPLLADRPKPWVQTIPRPYGEE